jgi:hypothetical protein
MWEGTWSVTTTQRSTPPPEKDGGFLIENEELKIEKIKH